MNYLITTYTAYILITILLTMWVGKTLFKNGRIFLLEIFNRDEEITDSINHLLLIGFYLINFGYVLRNLIVKEHINSLADCIEMLSIKIGLIIIVLGVMHFFNLFMLFTFRAKAKKLESAYN